MLSRVNITGLYAYPVAEYKKTKFAYVNNGIAHHAADLSQVEESVEHILSEGKQIAFSVDPDGRQIIALFTSRSDVILYQQLSNGKFIRLTPVPRINFEEIIKVRILDAPLPNGRLKRINGSIISGLKRILKNAEKISDETIFIQVFLFLNSNLDEDIAKDNWFATPLISSSGTSGIQFSKTVQTFLFDRIRHIRY